MKPEIERALLSDRLIDITTTGRKTGNPHRIEIGLYSDGEHAYLSGRPMPKDWNANLLAKAEFTLHLKQSVKLDLPARAIRITNREARRRVIEQAVAPRHPVEDLQAWVAGSPLYRIHVLDEGHTPE